MPPAARGPKLRAMRDIETIDSELRLLLAIRRMVREEEGRPPNSARIDAVLEKQRTLVASRDEHCP